MPSDRQCAECRESLMQVIATKVGKWSAGILVSIAIASIAGCYTLGVMSYVMGIRTAEKCDSILYRLDRIEKKMDANGTGAKVSE